MNLAEKMLSVFRSAGRNAIRLHLNCSAPYQAAECFRSLRGFCLEIDDLTFDRIERLHITRRPILVELKLAAHAANANWTSVVRRLEEHVTFAELVEPLVVSAVVLPVQIQAEAPTLEAA